MNDKIRKKIENGREYRSMVLEVRDEDENQEKIVEGYATTFEEPYTLWEDDEKIVKEQVSANAFDDTDMTDVIFQYDHEGRVFARISNETMRLEKDDHGLKVMANLGGTTEGRNLYEEIAGGYTNKMSFGFTVAEDAKTPEGEEDGKRVYLRTIKKVGKLYDVSAVSLPANEYTTISARKQLDGAIEELEEEFRKLERERREKEAKVENLRNRLKTLKGDK